MYFLLIVERKTRYYMIIKDLAKTALTLTDTLNMVRNYKSCLVKFLRV